MTQNASSSAHLIRSEIRSAAMMPAMRAVPSTSHFLALPRDQFERRLAKKPRIARGFRFG
jgi:hypothetical protein